jgi:hypothetical protein
MACSDENRDKSRRPGVEDRGRSHRSGTRWPDGQEVRWRRVRSAPGTWRLGARVSWLSIKTKVDGFVSGLASKPLGRFLAVWPQNLLQRFSPVWAQNWWRQVFPVWPQNRWSVCWLSLKTKVVEGFLVWTSKPAGLVIWASKSPRRFLGLGLKTNQASVCRLRHKTDEERSARDTRRNLATCLAWKQV